MQHLSSADELIANWSLAPEDMTVLAGLSGAGASWRVARRAMRHSESMSSVMTTVRLLRYTGRVE
jgi:hypothetical protein